MASQVTLHVFSGRADPTWQLTPQQEEQLRDRLGSSTNLTDRRPSGLVGGLGYRGFSVRRTPDSPAGGLSLWVHEGILDQGTGIPNVRDDSQLEAWLLDTSGPVIDDAVRSHVSQGIARADRPFANLLSLDPADKCPKCVAADAPAYNPGLWNIPAVQPYNNCYNYANNRPTNTFAQPGRGSGHPNHVMACSNVTQAAIYDGLTTAPNFSTPRGPGSGYYVALVVWPNYDYHWYRQDNVGCWSHKPGQTAVRNVDNSGNPITDPATCDRGPYTDFCGYMVTTSAVVIS